MYVITIKSFEGYSNFLIFEESRGQAPKLTITKHKGRALIFSTSQDAEEFAKEYVQHLTYKVVRE